MITTKLKSAEEWADLFIIHGLVLPMIGAESFNQRTHPKKRNRDE
jgi:hypothetical protein